MELTEQLRQKAQERTDDLAIFECRVHVGTNSHVLNCEQELNILTSCTEFKSSTTVCIRCLVSLSTS